MGGWNTVDGGGPGHLGPLPGEPTPSSAPAATLRGGRDSRPASVRCECGHQVFDGEAIRSRCVKPAEGLALCRCKRWVAVPVRLVQ